MDSAAWYLSNVINFPIVLIVGIYLMYDSVGISFLSGIGIMVIMGFVNALCGKFYLKLTKSVMVKKDERMSGTTEILNSIKYIKMSGWENSFLQKVLDLLRVAF